MEEVQKMTDGELNLKVAGLCGGVWKSCECGHVLCDKTMRWHWLDGTITNECPNYAGDLNAIHEAEMEIIHDVNLEEEYESQLRYSMDDNLVHGVVLDALYATARQRAEAFVMALDGK